jgi:heme exporter protein A
MLNTATEHTILTVNSLAIKRSERYLFTDLSFQLNSSEVIQIVGANGSGKTSLLRALTGLLSLEHGMITWHPYQTNSSNHTDDATTQEPSLPLLLGHLPAVKKELSVLENLLYHPIGGQFFEEQAIEKALLEVGLSFYADTPARNLSAGQTRKIGLARLLIADNPCWILDEPFTSLDKAACQWLEAQIEAFISRGGSVILTSHQNVNLECPIRSIELKPVNELFEPSGFDQSIVDKSEPSHVD